MRRAEALRPIVCRQSSSICPGESGGIRAPGMRSPTPDGASHELHRRDLLNRTLCVGEIGRFQLRLSRSQCSIRNLRGQTCKARDRQNWTRMTAHTTFPLAAGTDTFFKLAFAFGVIVAGLEIGYLLYSPLPFDPVGYLVGRDFANTWVGGELALT